MNEEILKNGYCLIENFVPQTLKNQIEALFTSGDFPWFYNEGIWGKTSEQSKCLLKCDENVIDPPGLTHALYSDGEKISQYCDIFLFLLMFVEKECNFLIDEILRVRARLTCQFPGHNESKYCGPHVDFSMDKKYYSLIYYVNDSDGDTFLFNETRDNTNLVFEKPTIRARITPRKGNILVFRGDIYHSGNNPIRNKSRLIVNYDFTIK